MNTSNDDEYFLKVAQELANKRIDEALWTKAYALENGDERKTKAHYIRLRVAKLQESVDKPSTPKSNAPNLESSPRQESVQPANRNAPEEEYSDATLWQRFWARSIDFLICLLLMQPFTAVLSQVNNIYLSIAISFFVSGVFLVFYDATLTTIFGATIGKWIAGIKVRRSDGTKSDFSNSLRRALSVFASGNGLYLFYPIVSAFAWWNARKELLQSGVAKWDRNCDTVVTQGHSNNLRNIIVGIIGLSCLCASVLVIQIIKQTNKSFIREATIDQISGKQEITPQASPPSAVTFPSEPVAKTNTPPTQQQSIDQEPQNAWQQVDGRGDSRMFVKKDTLSKNGSVYSIVFIEDFGTGYSAKGILEMICAQNSVRVVHAELYDSSLAQGKPFDVFDQSKAFETMNSGHQYQGIVNFVCR